MADVARHATGNDDERGNQWDVMLQTAMANDGRLQGMMAGTMTGEMACCNQR